MVAVYYEITLFLSLLFAAGYVFIWHKHFDVNFTLIFTLVPVACLGYCLSAFATTLEGALTAQKVIYIGGCFLQLFIALSIFNLCKIKLPHWLRTAVFMVCALIYWSVLGIGRSDKFYKTVTLKIHDGVPVLIREYGYMHTIFYVLTCVLFLSGIIAIIYSWFRKKDVPRRILLLLVIPDVICVSCYVFVLKIFDYNFDILPLAYCLAEAIYLLIAYRVNMYDVGDTVIDSMVQEEEFGYISFDFQTRYLGSNEVARRIVPELNDVAVDDPFGYKPSERKIRHFIEAFKKDPSDNTGLLTLHDEQDHDNDRYYTVNVNYLYDGHRKRGYIITFNDDTENRKYIKLLDTYNEDLKREVEQKTQHIVQMHDNLIMSLAMMVEMLAGALAEAGTLSGVHSWNTVPGEDANTGHFFAAINPEFFGGLAKFTGRMEAVIAELTSGVKAEGVSKIYYPGELEFLSEAKALSEGIELPVASTDELERAEKLLA